MYEYFDKHTPDGSTITGQAETISQTAERFVDLKDDVTSQHNAAQTGVDGDPATSMPLAPAEAKSKATELYRRAIIAGIAVKEFGGAVSDFNSKVDGWNSQIFHAPDKEAAEKSYEANLPAFNTQEGALNDAADSARAKLTNWDDDDAIESYWKAGDLPASAKAMFPGLDLRFRDLDELPADLANLSDKELAERVADGKIPDPMLDLLPDRVIEIVGENTAQDVKDHKIDENTVRTLDKFKDNETFAHSFYDDITPDEMAEAIHLLNAQAYPGENTQQNEELQDYRDVYTGFMNAAGVTLATYSQASGANAPPGNLAQQWAKAITNDDQENYRDAAALTSLIKAGGHHDEGEFDSDFLADLTGSVYEWERGQHGGLWSERGHFSGVVDPNDPTANTSDGLANLLAGMEHSPDAAKDFFMGRYHGHDPDQSLHDRINYLAAERTWADFESDSDEGEGLGRALEAATVGDGRSDDGTRITNELFKTIASYPDGQHLYANMPNHVGTIAAGYSDDLYDLLRDHGNSAATEHLDISQDDLHTVLGEIGRPIDKSGLETVTTALMMETRERNVGQLEGLDHNVLDMTDSESDSFKTLQEHHGDVLNNLLKHGLSLSQAEEDSQETREAIISKSLDIGADFLPTPGKAAYDVVRELGDAVEDGRPSSSDYYRDAGDDLAQQLSNNLMADMYRAEYDDDGHHVLPHDDIDALFRGDPPSYDPNWLQKIAEGDESVGTDLTQEQRDEITRQFNNARDDDNRAWSAAEQKDASDHLRLRLLGEIPGDG